MTFNVDSRREPCHAAPATSTANADRAALPSAESAISFLPTSVLIPTRIGKERVNLLVEPLRVVEHDEMPRLGHGDLAVLELRVLLAESALNLLTRRIVFIGDPRAEHERWRFNLGDIIPQIVGE